MLDEEEKVSLDQFSEFPANKMEQKVDDKKW